MDVRRVLFYGDAVKPTGRRVISSFRSCERDIYRHSPRSLVSRSSARRNNFTTNRSSRSLNDTFPLFTETLTGRSEIRPEDLPARSCGVRTLFKEILCFRHKRDLSIKRVPRCTSQLPALSPLNGALIASNCIPGATNNPRSNRVRARSQSRLRGAIIATKRKTRFRSDGRKRVRMKNRVCARARAIKTGLTVNVIKFSSGSAKRAADAIMRSRVAREIGFELFQNLPTNKRRFKQADFRPRSSMQR